MQNIKDKSNRVPVTDKLTKFINILNELKDKDGKQNLSVE